MCLHQFFGGGRYMKVLQLGKKYDEQNYNPDRDIFAMYFVDSLQVKWELISSIVRVTSQFAEQLKS